MTHGGTDHNITFYQETSLQYYEKKLCIVATVFNKRIKKFYEGHNNVVFSTWKQQLRSQ